MIVIDASAVIELLFGRPSGARVADELAHDLAAAPQLLDVEVAQVIRRHELGGGIDRSQAVARLEGLADLPVHRYPHRPLIARAYAWRHNVTVYDGVYLALAEALDARLLTADRSLGRVPGCTATVDVIV